MIGTQGIDGDGQCQGRINASREADDAALKAIFMNVVTGAQHQGLVGLGIWGEIGRNQTGLNEPLCTDREQQVIFNKASGPCSKTAIGIRGKAVAIEDEFILTTNQIAHHGCETLVVDVSANNVLPLDVLLEVKWRGV